MTGARSNTMEDEEIESFITKVDAVNAAIQDMRDGKIDPADVHVDGVPTIEEERQMKLEKRRKRLELAKRERETRVRKRREERDKWWRGGELLYGTRKRLTASGALAKWNGCCDAQASELNGTERDEVVKTARRLSDEERARLKERYSLEYGRWDTWTPSDPATVSELAEKEEEEEQQKSKEFEANNPDFCQQMIDDMKTRSEASQKKDSQATAARLKGNRFYRCKRWTRALELYMDSLRARPYDVNTLANIAQVYMKLQRWFDAVEFCDRALHVDGTCIKALSRRASSFLKLAEGHCHSEAVTTASPQQELAVRSDTLEDYPVQKEGTVSNDINGSKDGAESTPPDEEGTEENTVDQQEMFHDLCGERDGLRALAWCDLNSAIVIDPESTEVRRTRDALGREMDEEKAEAEVMRRARRGPPTTTSGLDVPAKNRDDAEPPTPTRNDRTHSEGAKSVSKSLDSSEGQRRRTCASLMTPLTSRSSDARRGAQRNSCEESNAEQDIRDVDQLLGALLAANVAIICSTRGADERSLPRDDSERASRLKAWSKLTGLLVSSSTARVYLRASGGLLEMCEAAAALLGSSAGRRNTAVKSGSALNTTSTSGGFESVSTGTDDSPPVDCNHEAAERVTFAEEAARMLESIATALAGGERVAQHEVLKSGLLGAPCACALRSRRSARESKSIAAEAALVLLRVVDDIDVRFHVARSVSIIEGLTDVVAAAPSDSAGVEAAAATVARLLLGRTARLTIESLAKAQIPARGNFPGGQGIAPESSALVHAVVIAICAWMKGGASVQAAHSPVGAALCSVLGNAAMHEELRGLFAAVKSFVPGQRAALTVAEVLVSVAAETKAGRAEARLMAVSALTNACLHNERVQAATLSAGGLTLALAALSLERSEREIHLPPSMTARLAKLLARLSAHGAARAKLAQPAAFERIVQAIVRSASLGGNLQLPVHSRIKGAHQTEKRDAADADANERESLVHTLAVVLRSTLSTLKAGDVVERQAPSSNICTEDTRRNLHEVAVRLELPRALLSFLPPAREDGVAGVTPESVSLIPDWCAPPELAANVCGCLLNLLDEKGHDRIAQQVVDADGIPRLISLFANSGEGGATQAARKNAAICIAKLARDADQKKAISDLRGMEMLLQAGRGLAT